MHSCILSGTCPWKPNFQSLKKLTKVWDIFTVNSAFKGENESLLQFIFERRFTTPNSHNEVAMFH